MNILDALWAALDPLTFLLVFLGTLFGLIFGVIPGLTAILAIVLLIPLTYGMDALMAIAMLIGVYIGGISGGLVTAILLGMPGTPASIATTFDGFPLAQKGEAGKALGVGITSNLVGCMIGWLALILLAPFFARIAVAFGPVEYVAVIIFGFTTVISLSGNTPSKGLIACLLGLLCSIIGMDPATGMMRNTFGFTVLDGGISSIPAMIGLFVLTPAFREVEQCTRKYIIPRSNLKNISMSRTELRRSRGNFLRSGIIGVLIGILPGIGGTLANFVAYDQAKKHAPRPDTFGTGDIQGIVASETANNAVIGGTLIPLLVLGIPGDAVTAVLLGGLQLHGIEPGPLLMRDNPQLLYGIFAYFLVASLFMFVLMFAAGARIFPMILRISKTWLLPVVIMASLVGCYNISYATRDLWISFVFGVIGYFLQKAGYPLVPLVISLVLGLMFEKQLRLALSLTDGSLLPFLQSPYALLFLALALFSVLWSGWKARHPAASPAWASRNRSPTIQEAARSIARSRAARSRRPGAGLRQSHGPVISGRCGQEYQASGAAPKGASRASTQRSRACSSAGPNMPRAMPDWLLATTSSHPAALKRARASGTPGSQRQSSTRCT